MNKKIVMHLAVEENSILQPHGLRVLFGPEPETLQKLSSTLGCTVISVTTEKQSSSASLMTPDSLLDRR